MCKVIFVIKLNIYVCVYIYIYVYNNVYYLTPTYVQIKILKRYHILTNQAYSNYEISDIHEVALTCLPKLYLILDVMLINGQMWVAITHNHKFYILRFFKEDLQNVCIIKM